MSIAKREVFTVTSSPDPRSLVNAMGEVPVGAVLTGLDFSGIRGYARGTNVRELAVLTFERPVEL